MILRWNIERFISVKLKTLVADFFKALSSPPPPRVKPAISTVFLLNNCIMLSVLTSILYLCVTQMRLKRLSVEQKKIWAVSRCWLIILCHFSFSEKVIFISQHKSLNTLKSHMSKSEAFFCVMKPLNTVKTTENAGKEDKSVTKLLPMIKAELKRSCYPFMKSVLYVSI